MEEIYETNSKNEGTNGILNGNLKDQIYQSDQKKEELFRIFGICEKKKEIHDPFLGKGGVIQFICGDHDFEEKCYCGREDKVEDKMIACDYCSKKKHISFIHKLYLIFI